MIDSAVQVSVYCLAYNHEKYIRKTLEGFVNQKTNFRYKVVIHEDASTDATAEIIREYEEKYPEIFDVIYEKENQYSKDPDIIDRCMIQRLEGKYVAYCEGDDYWCDENKLQKQYDIMEENPDVAMCLHRVGQISESGERIDGTYPAAKLGSGYLSTEQFIDRVCSDFFQMSSLFCRKDEFCSYTTHTPEYALKADVGDIPFTLYISTHSNSVYFFDEIMSCYRVNSESSVMRDTWNDNEKLVSHYKAIVEMIESFDQYTQGRYHAACENFKEMKTFEGYAKQKNIIEILKHPSCWRRFMRLPLRAQASIAVKGFLLAVKNKVNRG